MLHLHTFFRSNRGSYNQLVRLSSVTALTEDTGYFFGPLAAGLTAHFFGFPATFFGFGIFILFVMGVAILIKLR